MTIVEQQQAAITIIGSINLENDISTSTSLGSPIQSSHGWLDRSKASAKDTTSKYSL